MYCEMWMFGEKFFESKDAKKFFSLGEEMKMKMFHLRWRGSDDDLLIIFLIFA